MPDQRDANEIKIAESLLAIEGRLVAIGKDMNDLRSILEILSRHIIKEKDDASKKPSTAWEVDTWRPEKR